MGTDALPAACRPPPVPACLANLSESWCVAGFHGPLDRAQKPLGCEKIAMAEPIFTTATRDLGTGTTRPNVHVTKEQAKGAARDAFRQLDINGDGKLVQLTKKSFAAFSLR